MASAEDKALDDLYAGDLEGFTARRNELAKQLRADGDAAAADRVKALKKPTRSAWAVNRFSGGKAKLRKELLDAGAALRKTQERLVAGDADRDDVRAASERERQAVRKARAAIAADVDLSAAALEKVDHTLHAVALDDDVRRDFEQGRLTEDHEAVGLGGSALAAAAPAGKGKGKAKKDAKRTGGKAADRRRQKLKDAADKVGELERREKEADLSETAARDVAERAERDLKHAQRELKAATRALDEAKKRLEALQNG